MALVLFCQQLEVTPSRGVQEPVFLGIDGTGDWVICCYDGERLIGSLPEEVRRINDRQWFCLTALPIW